MSGGVELTVAKAPPNSFIIETFYMPGERRFLHVRLFWLDGKEFMNINELPEEARLKQQSTDRGLQAEEAGLNKQLADRRLCTDCLWKWTKPP